MEDGWATLGEGSDSLLPVGEAMEIAARAASWSSAAGATERRAASRMLARPVRLPDAIRVATRCASAMRLDPEGTAGPRAARPARLVLASMRSPVSSSRYGHRLAHRSRSAAGFRRSRACSRSGPPAARTGCGPRRATTWQASISLEPTSQRDTRRRRRSRAPSSRRSRSSSGVLRRMNACASTIDRPRISSRSAPALKARSPAPWMTTHPTVGSDSTRLDRVVASSCSTSEFSALSW